jgi:protocatechuate 3,4-dioxygenase alpha subunit
VSKQTPSQTVGPYFRIGLYSDNDSHPRVFTGQIATADVAGERIRIEGAVYDGAGDPIPDCMLEFWQADGEGRYRTRDGKWNDGFTGFGRVGTEEVGQYAVDTIMPGRIQGPDGTLQAPHVTVLVYMRGMLLHAFTRIYFDDHEAANADDPILALVPEERRPTLIARRRSAKGAPAVYHFDIQMQGDDETVFFDV